MLKLVLYVDVLKEFVIGEYMKLFKINDRNICLVRNQNVEMG